MKVTEPGGTTVRIGRRWLPWRRRLRGLDSPDLPIPDGDDPVSAVLAVVGLIIAIPFLVIFTIALGELLILLALLPLLLLARVVLRRPWTVDVTRSGELVSSHRAADWAASGELIGELAAQAARGELRPQR